MNNKDKYIRLFNFILNAFNHDGLIPNQQLPADLKQFFNIDISFINPNNSKNPQPIFQFISTDLENGKELKFLLCPRSVLISETYQSFRDTLTFNGILTTSNKFFHNTVASFVFIIQTKAKNDYYFSKISNIDDLYNAIFEPESFNGEIYFVNKNEIDYTNLLPENYDKISNSIKNALNNFSTRKLGDIAEIIYGRQIPVTDKYDFGIPIITPVNIENKEIDNIKFFLNRSNLSLYKDYLVMEGDTVLSITSNGIRIAFVTERDIPSIISNNVIIIRTHSIPDNYLFKYLSSETGRSIFQKQLENNISGAGIPTLSRNKLSNIEIPILDMETMDNIDNITYLPSAELQKIASFFSEKRIKNNNGIELEKYIYNSFLENGWNKQDIKRDFTLSLNNNQRFNADIALFDTDKCIGIVEVKLYFNKHTMEQFSKQMINVLQHSELIYILTTGNYFEACKYSNEKFQVHKYMTVPTKKEILDFIKGDN